MRQMNIFIQVGAMIVVYPDIYKAGACVVRLKQLRKHAFLRFPGGWGRCYLFKI